MGTSASASTAAWFVPARRTAPSDLEAWLERKAAEGLVVNEIDALSTVRLRLDREEAQQLRYAIDERRDPSPDYFRARADLGWDHVGDLGAFHLWRRPYTGDRPEGFIGSDLGRRARLTAVALAVVGVLLLALTLALGIASGVAGVAADLAVQIWAPAVATGILGLGSLMFGAHLGISHRRGQGTNQRTGR